MTRERTYYVESLGCVANRSDTARVATFLEGNGYQQVASPTNASLVVLMTCAFDEAHENANIVRVQELQQAKRADAQVIVGGCLSAINGPRLSSVFNGPTFTPRTLVRLNEIVAGPRSIEEVEHSYVDSETGMRAIRVSTGCMHRCTFCAIPFANGRTLSRPIGGVLDDIRREAAAGARAFRLVSEDVGAYGLDCGSNIVELIEALLASDVEAQFYLDYVNLQWVYRFRWRLLDLLADSRIGKVFHWPAQSGSDHVLRLMKRGYTVAQAREVFDEAFRRFPGVRITSDFMVGFPGETDSDFGETRALVKAYPFFYCSVFKYEDRPNTVATGMSGHISPEVQEERFQALVLDAVECVLRSRKINKLEDLKKVSQRAYGLLNTNASVA